jgi:deoxycytidine triphosphate deaminase
MTSFAELIPQTGFLTDRQILIGLGEGYLLEKGTWEQAQLRHASYTLRLGERVAIARAANLAHPNREFTLVNLTQAEPRLEVRPGDIALLYSKEYLRLPDCVLGFTVARGLLFAEALSPENTYVDPGFTGPIYTTVVNVSNRVVYLDYGMSLTRLFFVRLGESVQDGYRTGAALGIAQQLSSVRAVSLGSVEECRMAPDKELMDSIELIPIGGIQAAEVFQRLNRRQRSTERRLFTLVVVWPVLLVLANNSNWVKDNMGIFLGNVLASVVAAVLMLLVPKLTMWLHSGPQ